jgi:hypothetical protein
MFPTRPFTSKLPASFITAILCFAPAHAGEHIVHAWNALDAADRGEKPDANRAYARARLACAKSQPVSRAVKRRDRDAFEAELRELEVAVALAG